MLSLHRQLCQHYHPPPALVSNWQGKWQMPFFGRKHNRWPPVSVSTSLAETGGRPVTCINFVQ
jgi:hypothetical protein